MFKIRAKLQAPRLQLGAYRRELEAQARDTLGRAMLEYALTFQQIVPVWSGASHGALTHLMSLISAPLVINPVVNIPGFNGPGYGASASGASLHIEDSQFSFKFETALPHLVYNESTNANTNPDPGLRGRLLNPGPYHFRGETEEAVRVVLREFEMPRINNFIIPRRV